MHLVEYNFLPHLEISYVRTVVVDSKSKREGEGGREGEVREREKGKEGRGKRVKEERREGKRKERKN